MEAICPNAALLVRESPSFQREKRFAMSRDYTLRAQCIREFMLYFFGSMKKNIVQ